MSNPLEDLYPRKGKKGFGTITEMMRKKFLDFLESKQFEPIRTEFMEAATMEDKMKVAEKIDTMLGPDGAFERQYQFVKNKVAFKCEFGAEGFRKRGNMLYQKGDKRNALVLYTQCIANAPLDSVELALGYANRSAVLRSMMKCRECLEDIERALSHGYPTEKSFKLLLRELQCHRDLENMMMAKASFNKAAKLLQDLSEISEGERATLMEQLVAEIQSPNYTICTKEVFFPTEVPELSYGANPEVVGASSAVRIEYNEQQGRHLVATRDINMGDVLLTAENLVVTLLDEFKYDHCTHCHKPCYNLIPCPNCYWMMFCSKKCQGEANPKYHNAECAPYSKYRHIFAASLFGKEQFFDRIFRLFAIIGIDNIKPYLKYARTNLNGDTKTNEEKRTLGFNFDRVFDPNNIDIIFNLCKDFRGTETELLVNSLNALKIPLFFGIPKTHPDYHAVAGLYIQLENNAAMSCLGKSYIDFNPTVMDSITAAACFNPLKSLINHSCVVGNISHTLYDNTLVVLAKCPIAKGSILTDPYVHVDPKWSKEERQKFVKQECGFDCKCVPCEENWSFADKSKISDPDDQELASKIVYHMTENVLIDMQRNFAKTFVNIPKFESFAKERLEFLTKMWNKGEFLDPLCVRMQYQLDVYYFLQGNRVLCPINHPPEALNNPHYLHSIIESITRNR